MHFEGLRLRVEIGLPGRKDQVATCSFELGAVILKALIERTKIDPARVEPRIVLHVQVEMNTQDRKVMDAFQRAMKASPEVQGCWDVTGETDFLLTVAVRSMAEYESFCQRELTTDAHVRAFAHAG